MSSVKPRLPKGFRDFLPATMQKREYVFGIVRDVFHLYGFEPLQTPTLELRETLFGKYGEDAENLIYDAKHQRGEASEPLAMRYDLTVPLARVVAMYENDLKLPFKRYQISPVWRGERPQRGRYREFYQCDADIVGVAGMSADAELVSLACTALLRLGFQTFTVKINSRKLLTAMGIYSGVPSEQLPDLYRSVDKFDKIGAGGVEKELVERGIAPDVVARMMDLLTVKTHGEGNLDALEARMGNLPSAQEALRELREMAHHMRLLGVPEARYDFDFTVVRGLGYYTGPIFETVITEPNIGSISGGGRYDNLIGIFRKESLPTTGISLGIERIIDLMDEFGLYPPTLAQTVVQVLVTVFDAQTQDESTRLTSELRQAGIHTELYMDDGKLKLGKQFTHADKKGIPLVAILGADEIAQGVVKLKRLADGVERAVPRDSVVPALQELLKA
jgi:histidyl-tRNA synthetase